MSDTFRIALRAMVVAAMTLLTVSTATAQVKVHGNVYGGGNLADVKENAAVNMSAGHVFGNVFGGGKGKADNFKCDKAMVGEEKTENADANPGSNDNKDKGTIVTISNGTVGTLEGEEGAKTLKAGTGNVYGGGEIGRVEWNTQVRIGVGTEGGTFAPVIYGNVFGAGKGLETHGYSALVRGNSTVTIQGKAMVGYNVYGGGEMSTVGRYWVKGIVEDPSDPAPEDLPDEMPYKQRKGGICSVTIQGDAEVGYNGAANDKGHVFGAGKGVGQETYGTYTYVEDNKSTMPKRMIDDPGEGNDDQGRPKRPAIWEPFADDPRYIWEYYSSPGDYFVFLQTLSLVTNSNVTIAGSAQVKGSTYGGSESGFVQNNTNVQIQGGTIGTEGSYGNVFGGGKGLETFAEAGRVKGNATVAVSGDGTTIQRNVYGGGELGHVGTFVETADGRYIKKKDKNGVDMNTGLCTVSITGGKIGPDNNSNQEIGNVFGAGKGKDDTFKCEKAMTMETSVSVGGGTVNGNVYGGGEVGRVEYDTEVTIGRKSNETTEGLGTGTPQIKGSVFGGGAGVETHGYSALVRGNTRVDVEGATGAKVNGSVFGGGEIASVGRYGLNAENMPNILLGGGTCVVNVRGSVEITGDVFGAGQGVDPSTFNKTGSDKTKLSRRMTVYSATDFPEAAKISAETGTASGTTLAGTTWEYYDESVTPKLVWEYYQDADAYSDYLQTLALATRPEVTIGGNSQVKGSVFGGGELGLTKGSVTVTINGGTIGTLDTDGNPVVGTGDVYGGGSLADTNTTSKVGVLNGDGVPLNTNDQPYQKGDTYKTNTVHPTTIVRLLGGLIYGDAYGGGLGRLSSTDITAVAALVVGDVLVDLNGVTTVTTGEDGGRSWTDNTGATNSGTTITGKGCIVNRIFGCNNLNGTPQKNVTVHVFATQNKATSKSTIGDKFVKSDVVLTKGEDETDENYLARLKGYLDDKINEATAIGIDVTSPTDYQDVYRNATDPDDVKTAITGLTSAINTALNTGTELEKATKNTAINAVRYDVEAVYGGGNVAAYVPVYNTTTGATEFKTQVLIEGCDYTSIETVYGGGNAAAVPETNVDIKGAYEIGYLFGGGNGKDDIAPGVENPGADVGTLDHGTTTYGTGNANTLMEAGLIHEVYGGSNTKGIIKGAINQITAPKDPEDVDFCCELEVDKIVGAGKYADIDGDVNMTLSCQPSSKVPLLFAGADEANVNGNITLNITNGNFGKVFGGNNLGGAVKGKITVNVEETGCQPIKIDELYLGGNEAAYSIYGYYESDDVHDVTGLKILKPRTAEMHAITDPTAEGYKAPVTNPTPDATHTFPYAQPELNIISCTYIGNVFGGGFGEGAVMYANPTVNVNMVKGAYGDNETVGVPKVMTTLNLPSTENTGHLGIIENVFGGGDAADIYGTTTVNIATEANKGAYITGMVFGGGNNADVKGNTSVNMAGGYVKDRVYGGGKLGNVGTFTRKDKADSGHTHDGNCMGKPDTWTANTGRCVVTVSGGQVGPLGMTMPDDYGYVFGAGRGETVDPSADADVDFRTYVHDTRVIIKNTYAEGYATANDSLSHITKAPLICGGVYGGSEAGRVGNNTDVRIYGGQIGLGNGQTAAYTEAQWTAAVTAVTSGDASSIATAAQAMPECNSWTYDPTSPHNALPYDVHANDASYNAETIGAASTIGYDGHTFYGNVFGGGSGYFAYTGENVHGWLRSAGLVEGDTHVTISGGHILTSVYGGNELTDVNGKCYVKMTGGTLGVPRTLAQIAAHPVTCYLFGAGKGDQRIHFNTFTNVGAVDVNISGGTIFGSVFGGGEDGHVLGNVDLAVSGGHIGTWGTSYVDGNVFGGGRGFGGDALTAGVVQGNVDVTISDGTVLGSIYGGGRLGSVGTYLVPVSHENYGKLIPDGKNQDYKNWDTSDNNFGKPVDATGVTHGHVTIDISGGTIGNRYEYAYYAPNTTIDKTANHIPYTEFDATTNRLTHTKGGNVFTGAMGRLYALNGTTVLPHWLDLGKVKSTKLNISGSAVIKSSIYGGGELGWTSGTHKTSDNKDVSTEISITGGTIGSEIKDNNNVVQYTYGSVFGGGYGSDIAVLTDGDSNKTYPIYQAGRVMNSTAVTMSSGTVKASVYGGGELANVGYGFYSFSNVDYGIGETALAQASDAANTYITVSGGTIGIAPITASTGNTYFGGATMGNVYGGGSGNKTISRCGLVLGNTNVNISGTNTRIYHNVYGGGAYGSVGDYEYATETVQQVTRVKDPNAVHTSDTGTANVTITGGIIGYDGKDNGMVFGSSRGDVQGEDSRDDYMAWVYDTHVTIDTEGEDDGPAIKGSVYGSGENGHVFHNTDVKIYNGTIGIDNADTSVEGYIVISDGTTYNGPEYTSRGNVYGGGCGTDTYTKNGKEYFNPIAGIVKGNTTVTMTGGHVVRAVYGGGSMGSVGTFTDDENGKPISCVEAAEAVPATDTTPAVPAVEGTGLCTVTISGGKIGPTTMAMPNYYGNVFGAGRGEVHDPADYPNLETSAYFNRTEVTINGTAFVKGSVYGGSESGHVLNDTKVEIDGNCQIGCGYDGSTNGAGDLNRVYTAEEWAYDVTTGDNKFLYECNSWPYRAPYTPYDKFADDDGEYPDGSSADNAHSTGTDGHTFYGNVFGGGSGSTPYAPGKWLPTAGWVEGNTSVEIKGGHILTSVYGGNEMSDVGAGGVRKMTDLINETADMFYDITKSGGKCTVKMSGGTLGVPRTLAQIAAHPLTCYLFGAGKGDQRIFFNKTTNVKEVEVEVSGGKIYGSVFGGGEDGHVMKDVKMTIKDNAYIGTWGTSYVDGNVFGGGRGFSGEALTAGNVGGSVNIDIQGGTMLGSIYGGGRLGSVGYGLYLVDEEIDGVKPYGILRDDNVDDRGNKVDNFKRGYIKINISGGTIGNDIEYKYNPTDADKQKMPSTQFDYQKHLTYTRGGNVFTGCMGRLYALDNRTLLPLWTKLGRCKQTELNITGGMIKSNVYGGAELGVVQENATVNITGGTVGTKVGEGENAYYYGSVFGSGKGSNDAITYPEGTDEEDKKDISEAGTVEGNVMVELNKDVAENAKGGVVHKIFGCNDMNGTPKGTVTVYVHATQKEDGATINDKAAKAATAEDGTYDVEAVYGGGNLAAYVPTKAVSGSDAEKELARPEVIIDGCGRTSIQQVYGGGNAAAAPATHIEVNSCYEIGTVFGGGNGKDALDDGSENPGADVGYKINSEGTEESYGTGVALAELRGGTIHKAFGGSNTKGNVRTSATVDLNEPDPNDCPLRIEEVYGAGNEADQDGTSNINLGCISFLSEIYGGAKNADVNNDIVLTIQSGRFDRVFGGNNLGGNISGTITVNIEEMGCHPIVIGQLFGGGNQAAYKAPDGKPGPTVNVKSFTSIGEIYGGGFGNSADITGNTFVNINEHKGKFADKEATEDFTDENGNPVTGVKVSENTGKWIHFNVADNKTVTVWQPEHREGAIGTIGNVFGGGNEANVTGSTNVRIGNESYVPIESVVAGKTDVRGYYTRTGAGTTESPYDYTPVLAVLAAEGATYYRRVVNNNEETYEVVASGITVGETDVSDYYTRSGAGTEESPYVYTSLIPLAKEDTTYYKAVLGANITGNVYGGGNAADVSGDTNVVIGREAPE